VPHREGCSMGGPMCTYGWSMVCRIAKVIIQVAHGVSFSTGGP